jgi:ABC-type glutathione transport system ATPase component
LICQTKNWQTEPTLTAEVSMVIQHSLSLLKDLAEIESKIEACHQFIKENKLSVELDELLIKSYLSQPHSTND